MSVENLGIKQIEQKDERTLKVQWTDNRIDEFDVVELRRNCPCALCVDEWTHERTLKAEDIPDSVRPTRIDSVGRYAMNIRFNDQHVTGIYTYKLLRSIADSASTH